jgi:hypothetical protein
VVSASWGGRLRRALPESLSKQALLFMAGAAVLLGAWRELHRVVA